MLIVLVHVHVKEEYVNAFKEASMENARQSVKEAGIARFDVLEQLDDPSRYILVEVYRAAGDPAKHKETAHYKKWRETVEPMLEEVRVSHKYENVFPEDQGWG